MDVSTVRTEVLKFPLDRADKGEYLPIVKFTATKEPQVSAFRYWKVHFALDPAAHWVSIDCGKRVHESEAVSLAKRAFSDRGTITNATPDFDRAGA